MRKNTVRKRKRHFHSMVIDTLKSEILKQKRNRKQQAAAQVQRSFKKA